MVLIFGKAGILGVLLVLSLAGCDFRRVVVNDPLVADSLEVLVPGKSTIQDVATVLGAPDEIEEGVGGMVFRYRYGDSKDDAGKFRMDSPCIVARRAIHESGKR